LKIKIRGQHAGNPLFSFHLSHFAFTKYERTAYLALLYNQNVQELYGSGFYDAVLTGRREFLE